MTCYFAELEQETLLTIEGPDSLTFLQGQTTCDTANIDIGHAGLGVYCTPQGRVVCDFLLAALGEEQYALRMRRDILDHAAAVLGKYIIFSKAELTSRGDEWQVAALWGDGADQALIQAFGAAPKQPLDSVHGPGFTVVRTHDQPRFECYITRDCDLAETLSAAATVVPASHWHAQELLAGMARIEAATVETFVPQVLNYDLTGHISFTKGCYTGQEVVARLHYRGTSKRRTYLVALPEDAPAGTAVLTHDSSQPIGDVVNCSAIEGEAAPYIALVSATTTSTDRPLHLQGAEEASFTLQPPPYPFPSD